ncbi:MFS transporter [Sinomicrobium sp. M5D2P9]
MKERYSIFRKFSTLEQARELESQLNGNGIDTVLADNVPPVDITFSGNTLQMKRISHLRLGTPVWIYAISRALERASFYGIRALLVLYMLSETINMPQQQALTIYGWLAFCILISQVLGAVFGDLVLGNKNTLIAGGAIHALGAFCLCIPSVLGLYTGIALIVLGSGFYTPNLLAHLGKQYQAKSKLLDAAFTILYAGINIGAALGVFWISYLGNINYSYGFAAAGILMLCSVALPLLIPETPPGNTEDNNMETSTGKSVLYVLVAFLLIALFWGVYEIANTRLFDIQYEIGRTATSPFSQYFLSSLNSAFLVFLSIVAAITWSFFYANRFLKLTAGFLVVALSFIPLFFIPAVATEQHIVLLVATVFLWGVAEILISPVIYSVLTRYTNPRYLAMVMSASFILSRIFIFLVSIFAEYLREVPWLVVVTGGSITIGATVVAASLFLVGRRT